MTYKQFEGESEFDGLRTKDNVRTTVYIAFVISLFAFYTRLVRAVTPSTPSSIVIQISPNSSVIDLTSSDHAAALRQASTPVHVTVTGAIPGMRHHIEVYACVDTETVMRLPGKPSTLATTNLHIRNTQGEWAVLEPLAELGGRRGVRIAILNGTSAGFLLQVQLKVLTNQAPGNYQGALTLLAQERE